MSRATRKVAEAIGRKPKARWPAFHFDVQSAYRRSEVLGNYLPVAAKYLLPQIVAPRALPRLRLFPADWGLAVQMDDSCLLLQYRDQYSEQSIGTAKDAYLVADPCDKTTSSVNLERHVYHFEFKPLRRQRRNRVRCHIEPGAICSLRYRVVQIKQKLIGAAAYRWHLPECQTQAHRLLPAAINKGGTAPSINPFAVAYEYPTGGPNQIYC